LKDFRLRFAIPDFNSQIRKIKIRSDRGLFEQPAQTGILNGLLGFGFHGTACWMGIAGGNFTYTVVTTPVYFPVSPIVKAACLQRQGDQKNN
jgi:hypothetical protein